MVHEQTLPTRVALDTLRFARERQISLIAFHGDRILCEQMDATIASVTTQHEPMPEAMGLQAFLVRFGWVGGRIGSSSRFDCLINASSFLTPTHPPTQHNITERRGEEGGEECDPQDDITWHPGRGQSDPPCSAGLCGEQGNAHTGKYGGWVGGWVI